MLMRLWLLWIALTHVIVAKSSKEMFTFNGPQFVKSLHDRGFDVFLDLKFHDIPNTVA